MARSDQALMEALHDFMVEYLEPQGVADNTVRAYQSDIVGIGRIAAVAGRPAARGLTGRELAGLAADTATDADLDTLTVDDFTPSVLRRSFGSTASSGRSSPPSTPSSY